MSMENRYIFGQNADGHLLVLYDESLTGKIARPEGGATRRATGLNCHFAMGAVDKPTAAGALHCPSRK
jgi:hypothetical protein